MLWGQKSTWGHLGSLGSNLVLCYIVFTCYSYIYAYALASTPLPIRKHLAHLSDKGLQVKQKKMAPAGVVLFEHSMSSSFFSSSFLSGNTSFSHTSLHPILTKLGQSDRYVDHYSGTKDDGVRGHHGVTGVKKVIFTKKASSPTE